jgi:hypothetical protein
MKVTVATCGIDNKTAIEVIEKLEKALANNRLTAKKFHLLQTMT